ncbi:MULTISPECIES: S24 family peptidase [unclassified Mesorhizobium]|uniref:XRE family transcriptional regulator n=1 Tax=unclassified Mesorhizobium TaxID=325217 RepID=UPI0016745104|nr:MULTISPECIES: S24 family peptidase [unclassified Mesorhizobium]
MQKELTTPADRLRMARQKAGYRSAMKAAEMLNVSAGTYGGHENGSRAFDAETVKKYASAFNVRPAWLMLGEEPMTLDEELGRLLKHLEEHHRVSLDDWDPAAPDDSSHDDEDGGAVAGGHQYKPKLPGARPEIDVRPGAGSGQIGAEVVAISSAGSVTGHKVVGEWLIPDAFFRHELQASPAGSILMAVIGDSMAPTLQPGNRIIVDTRQNSFGADGIYVFDDGDGEPRVKRLSKVLFSNPPAVTILSDNPALPPQNALLGDVRIIGRVVGQVSRL